MQKAKLIRLAAGLLLGLCQPPLAWSGVMSGHDLLSICEPDRADPVYRLKISECTGYIVGVSDSFDCSNKMLGFTWNSTQYASQEKLVATVIDWFHFHPHVLHYQASGLVASALAGRYPCPDSIATQ